ncbi:MAG TPA: proton-conducting transporter membrane subunit [Xanthobacteraceae bacterium]|nr:proton-conducting transporter membrane subunit [Xanthobacteraceae bacterium]
MTHELMAAAFLAWLLAAIAALTGRAFVVARVFLSAGCVTAIAAAIIGLPEGISATELPTVIAGEPVRFLLTPDALWLLGFGLAPAALACAVSTPSRRSHGGWLFGAAMSLIGALGVFGLQDGASFLIAWEIMSLGGAVMILSEKLASDAGRPVLFMLGLLEVGAVALVAAVLLLAHQSHTFDFATFHGSAADLPAAIGIIAGLLLIIGFGAKLGLLPFYEWFPSLYGSGSGASGVLLSGVVLNAAFFGLSRGLLDWLPGGNTGATAGLGTFLLIVAVISAILTALYAFQQEDWRPLLGFSSAENACIAAAMLGASLMFRGDGQKELASLAWAVALIHLSAHSLAKGGMFLTADGVYGSTGGYNIFHSDLLRTSSWVFGFGALFAAMSLSAMPPQAGFVSEWFVFQTVFQGFHLGTVADRLAMALAGAGLALTVAVSFATFVKVFGVGLLGRSARTAAAVSAGSAVVVGLLGVGVITLAVGMPAWLDALSFAVANEFGTMAAQEMHDGFLLVPLTAKFAFISPTLLVVVMPLLSIVPIALVLANRRYAVRRAPVWYGGFDQDPERASTTALTFSNAMRTFYSFVYRPTEEVESEAIGPEYFIHRLRFTHDVAPIFGPYLFAPVTRAVYDLANKLRVLQSGHLNFYLALIGGLLVIILALVLF